MQKSKRGECSNSPASPVSQRSVLLDSPITSVRTVDQTGGARHTGRQLTNQRPTGPKGRSLMTSPRSGAKSEYGGKTGNTRQRTKTELKRIAVLHQHSHMSFVIKCYASIVVFYLAEHNTLVWNFIVCVQLLRVHWFFFTLSQMVNPAGVDTLLRRRFFPSTIS